MALKKIIIIAMLLSGAAHAQEDLERIELTLTLPGATKAKALFYKRTLGDLTIYSLNRKLQGDDGTAWMNSLNRALDTAFREYSSVFSTEELSFCTPPLSSRPPISIAFYNFKKDESEDSRSGYYHPSNDALVLQDRFWNGTSITYLALHEAVHWWCHHEEYKSETQHWLEEGLADWVATKVTGRPEQRAITRYFEKPCQPTLYGSSYLWWLARDLSRDRPQDFLKYLASLHLGLRGDLVFGKMSNDACPPPEKPPTPFASLGTKSDGMSLPIWERPYRQPSLRAPQPEDKPTHYFRFNM